MSAPVVTRPFMLFELRQFISRITVAEHVRIASSIFRRWFGTERHRAVHIKA